MPSRFSANSILFVISLPSSDVGLARRCAEDIKLLSSVFGSLPVEIREISTSSDLLILLAEIEARNKRDGYRPILHFDIHGSKAGLQFADGSTTRWDKFVTRLERLNEKFRMNLVVSLAVCEGAWSILGIEGLRRSPFSLLLAPRTELPAKDAEKWVKGIFGGIIRNKTLSDSFRDGNAEIESIRSFQPYSSSELFDLAIDGYVHDHCDRASIRARVSRLRKGLRRIGIHPSRKDLDNAKQMVLLTAARAQKMWARFAWHDLGTDVAKRNPYEGTPLRRYTARHKNGKSRVRVIKRNRVGDHMYGNIKSYAESNRDTSGISLSTDDLFDET